MDIKFSRQLGVVWGGATEPDLVVLKAPVEAFTEVTSGFERATGVCRAVAAL